MTIAAQCSRWCWNNLSHDDALTMIQVVVTVTVAVVVIRRYGQVVLHRGANDHQEQDAEDSDDGGNDFDVDADEHHHHHRR